jgi:LuxR family maltose regulon positive regulatory protein
VGFVDRPALLDALDRGADGALTLLSAPPGFGKSLLLADWVRTRAGIPTAWVTIEPEDADPRRFWAAVLSALVRCPGVPPENRLHRLVVSPTTVELDFLADLVSAVDALPHRIGLILDGAHHLMWGEALHGVQMLMSIPSHRLRLIVAARRDPGLPVARMRLEEQLCELRAEQLRFTAAESALLLDRHGIGLDAAHTALLHERTGGWPVGLRLAVRQLRGHPDPGSFVTSFCGDERPVADYLVGELLEHLSDDEREVLRLTSICDPLPVKLAVELSGREDAAELLDRLERDTGMIARVDQRRSQYPRPAAHPVLPARRAGPVGCRVGEGAASSSCPLVQRARSSAGSCYRRSRDGQRGEQGMLIQPVVVTPRASLSSSAWSTAGMEDYSEALDRLEHL